MGNNSSKCLHENQKFICLSKFCKKSKFCAICSLQHGKEFHLTESIKPCFDISNFSTETLKTQFSRFLEKDYYERLKSSYDEMMISHFITYEISERFFKNAGKLFQKYYRSNLLSELQKELENNEFQAKREICFKFDKLFGNVENLIPNDLVIANKFEDQINFLRTVYENILSLNQIIYTLFTNNELGNIYSKLKLNYLMCRGLSKRISDIENIEINSFIEDFKNKLFETNLLNDGNLKAEIKENSTFIDQISEIPMEEILSSNKIFLSKNLRQIEFQKFLFYKGYFVLEQSHLYDKSLFDLKFLVSDLAHLITLNKGIQIAELLSPKLIEVEISSFMILISMKNNKYLLFEIIQKPNYLFEIIFNCKIKGKTIPNLLEIKCIPDSKLLLYNCSSKLLINNIHELGKSIISINVTKSSKTNISKLNNNFIGIEQLFQLIIINPKTLQSRILNKENLMFYASYGDNHLLLRQEQNNPMLEIYLLKINHNFSLKLLSKSSFNTFRRINFACLLNGKDVILSTEKDLQNFQIFNSKNKVSKKIEMEISFDFNKGILKDQNQLIILEDNKRLLSVSLFQLEEYLYKRTKSSFQNFYFGKI